MNMPCRFHASSPAVIRRYRAHVWHAPSAKTMQPTAYEICTSCKSMCKHANIVMRGKGYKLVKAALMALPIYQKQPCITTAPAPKT